MTGAPPWHIPVMVTEIMDVLEPGPGRVLIDATIGDGGHAMAWLEAGGTVVGIDRDRQALARTSQRLERWTGMLQLIHGTFSLLAEHAAHCTPDAVLFDLGTSRTQIESPVRGFSYLEDGPLDMRMDQEMGEDLVSVLQKASVETLAGWLRDLGDVPRARAIARAIMRAGPPSTTAGLAAVVSTHCPPRLRVKYLSCVFQALRMALNHEREELRSGLAASVSVTSPGARIAVLTYHSGEEREMRAFLRREGGQCQCPPGLPVCLCGAVRRLVTVESGRKPSPAEVVSNSRSRSARLWAAERVRVH